MKPDEILIAAADTFIQRNAVYKDNYRNVGKICKDSFPNGITLETEEDFIRFHLFLLVIYKISRYANNFTVGGHADSIHDSCVYAAMLESVDAAIKENTGNNKQK